MQSDLTIDSLTMILCEPKVGRIVDQRMDLVVADVDAQAGQGAHLIEVVEVEVAHRIVRHIDVLDFGQVLEM